MIKQFNLSLIPHNPGNLSRKYREVAEGSYNLETLQDMFKQYQERYNDTDQSNFLENLIALHVQQLVTLQKDGITVTGLERPSAYYSGKDNHIHIDLHFDYSEYIPIKIPDITKHRSLESYHTDNNK